MNCGEAIELLKRGDRVRREAWNDKDMWLALQAHRVPPIYVATAKGEVAPWWPSQEDILAEDWSLLYRAE